MGEVVGEIDDFRVVAVRAVEGIGADFAVQDGLVERLPGGRGVNVRRDGAPQLEGAVGQVLLHDAACNVGVVHVAHIDERHRLVGGAVFHIHVDVKACRSSGKPHRGAGEVVVAKALHVLVFANQPDGVRRDFQPGAVHLRAGKLAMQRVRVFRRGATARKQSGMEGETAVGIDDFPRRLRPREHVFHAQRVAVESRIPEDLPHEGQDFQMAARVGDGQTFDAARVTARGDGKGVGLQQGLRFCGEKRFVQGQFVHDALLYLFNSQRRALMK